MNFGDNQRPTISALSASFDQDAMCYAMFPSLSVDPTYARLTLFSLILNKWHLKILQNIKLHVINDLNHFYLFVPSNLTTMFKKALRNFYKMTGHKPVSLIFFRPGTNDQEVKRITYIELSAIRAACKELAEDYRFVSIDIIISFSK